VFAFHSQVTDSVLEEIKHFSIKLLATGFPFCIFPSYPLLSDTKLKPVMRLLLENPADAIYNALLSLNCSARVFS